MTVKVILARYKERVVQVIDLDVGNGFCTIIDMEDMEPQIRPVPAKDITKTVFYRLDVKD
jgi:hypothetical protein